MKKQNIALGFYHDHSTAQAVVAHLITRDLTRFAIIENKIDGSVEVKRHFPLTGWFGMISLKVLNRYKNRLIKGEILIIVEVNQSNVRDVLSVLRDVKSEHPITFFLRPPIREEKSVEIPLEALTLEEISVEAGMLAKSLEHVAIGKDFSQTFLKRFHKNDHRLQFLRRDIADAEFIEQTIPVPAEWLLDNMYVLENSFEDIKLNLPKKYYKELPKILKGPLEGFPRIYALASELVKNTLGNLNLESIPQFLKCYQSYQPLTTGELWAFPIMLRVRLIEWIEFLAFRVDNKMREGELANFWGNRLLTAARYDPEKVDVLLDDLAHATISFSGHFAEELVDHLFDEETVLPKVQKWLEEHFKMPLEEILRQDHLAEATEQIVFSDCIKSLINLSQLSWPEVFEDVNHVDAILKNDPTGVYAHMDFATRNSYREVIEEMSRRTSSLEIQIASEAIILANNNNRHVGYYLMDDGRLELEKKIHYHPSLMLRLRRGIIHNAALVYLGGIALLTLACLKIIYSYTPSILFLTLALIPVSELAIQAITSLLTLILPTHLRPKMSYKEGVPEVNKTLVVVPMILKDTATIKEAVELLEIRYLANTDPQVLFSLFSDYSDASLQHTEGDPELLNLALEGIRNLESKYGGNKFFLFHRNRVWSDSENAWIGWERKRGKLEYLNKHLLFQPLPENILYSGAAEALKGVKYVITLDADTQLPKDQAKAMIEVIAHPLNSRYNIIQPRVATDFVEGKVSLFCRIFSDPEATDPYTHAVSSLYQDLANEGSYHGKGIYNVAGFHNCLSDRFPESHLLSHDLIEGAFTGVGFASNICLFDSFPKDYLTWAKRQNRWIRGDWQIIDWLFPRVPLKDGSHAKNPLSWVSLWKIFDNLRRSLLPVAALSVLVYGWFTALPSLGTYLVLLVFALPMISLFVNKKWTYAFFSDLKIALIRMGIALSLLPIEACISLDALFRVLFRRAISHKHLLQWNFGESSCAKSHRRFLFRLLGISVLAVALLLIAPTEYAIPFCILWFFSPLIVYILDKPASLDPIEPISESDQQMLRKIARKTWRYFDEFMGPSSHWMPPDNYQTALNIEVAERTSPTNIGMGLLAIMNARDFNYITVDRLIDRLNLAFEELKKLERYEGHFLNWYNTTTLAPLYPRYVSTVDSGNLLASFWTIKQGLEEIVEVPILLPKEALLGLKDTYEIYKEGNPNAQMNVIQNISIANTLEFSKTIKETLMALEGGDYWQDQLIDQIKEWDSILSRYFSWIDILSSHSEDFFKKIDENAPKWKEEALSWTPSLFDLTQGNCFEKLLTACSKEGLPNDIKVFGKILKESIDKTQWFAGEKLGTARALIADIDQFSKEMNLKFLYNEERRLFSIGYNVDDLRMDSAHYDLLASESRITSFVGIAKEDVPLEHWWALGRLYNLVDGQRVLLSWGGTMFEYLMPLIFSQQYKDSLLGEACHAAVDCQIAYGKRRGIPWGISESAFSAIDSHKIYQYRSFGIPGLGIKRGLEEDLVISPYSTMLALAINLKESIQNLKAISENMLGSYGFYESMDYTRQRNPTGERGVVVYVYMAHHQGMILSVLNNVLNRNPIIRRFHNDPRISGVSSIIYERIPLAAPIRIAAGRKEPPLRRLEPFSASPIIGHTNTHESTMPKINILSNGTYSVAITNSGGGYSHFGQIEMYRFRADTTSDDWGSFCYIKDMESQKLWSAAYQPTKYTGTSYSVNFKGDKAEIRRRDNEIETFTEIVVAPDDNAEIRLLTLVNHSKAPRFLELTSYMELVLAPHATDRAHPCFNKMFIETESVQGQSALIAFRRLRSNEDQPIFAGHVLCSSEEPLSLVQYETDRGKFIGRGFTLANPKGLKEDLSSVSLASLDPIFSLRTRIKLEPGKRVQVSFVTMAANSRDSVLSMIDKYKNIVSSQRAIEHAWTYAQLELRHLRIQAEEVQLFQKLASRIIYPHFQLRSGEERLLKNKSGQMSLWAQGISGDLPILVVTVGDIYDVDMVKQVLIGHAFLAMRGLKIDVVLLNEEAQGYMQPLQEQLQSLIAAYSYRTPSDLPGGVYLRNVNKIPPDEINAILCAASVVLVASRGSLRQQLVSPKPHTNLPSKLAVNKKIQEALSEPLPFLELPYFNGLGGYSSDGKSYVIYLGPNIHTPAPWINVIANEQFGTIVSETGMGCTWFGNSQTNRLTPWSNDPLLNPISDTVYIRDEELGTYWTLTPSPVRELDAYRIHHGQGFTRFEHNSHGIMQELLVFVPPELSIRIQKIQLTNHSSRKRVISLTAYSEWVLGKNKESEQMHVITDWDSESQAIFASNRFNPDYASYSAFTCSTFPIASYTADRTEFIGRNSSSSTPTALSRTSLSRNTGAALDPCSCLQVQVALAPGEQIELSFIMGYTPDRESARELILDLRKPDSINKLYIQTKAWWDKTLEGIQVEVPDLATQFSMNRWLMYQTISCRFYARTAFYQSSGAYGYRDQLQDVMAITYFLPHIAREYILKAASRQYPEGDVQHWWHPQTGSGVRTRCSDDLLWLPFVTAQYIRITQDVSILEEKVPFIQGELLAEGQEEMYQTPTVSEETATLLEHCRRALNKGKTSGVHGLPLIGSCDWNDGMNRVGVHGKGESVWLAWFLVHVMNDFADLLELNLDPQAGDGYRLEAKRLVENIEAGAWDGAWYRRAYFDDGTPLGSKECEEAMIDSLAQSWSVISGLGDPERAAMGLKSASEYLVREKEKIVLLLTPPFDKTSHDPGYIKGYPPGIRENGGQYTHGSAWLPLAFARSGDGNKAHELLAMMSPNVHTSNLEACAIYKVEPYIIAADIYSNINHVGRGGWTWYTGSSAWIYRVWLEEILGFTLRGDKLSFKGSLPKEWDHFTIRYKHKSSLYEIHITNPNHLNWGALSITLDGVLLNSAEITLEDDAMLHKVQISIS